MSAAAAHERPALRRRTEDRLVAGVAGGLADWLNAPVGFIRIVLLLIASSSSEMILVYAAAALVIPARGHDRPSWDNLIGVGRLGLFVITPAFVAGGDGVELSKQSASVWIPLGGLELLGALMLLSSDYVRPRPRTDAEARATVLAAAPPVCCGAAMVAAVMLFPEPRWDDYVPLAALVAGAGLLAAAWSGRARPFVAPAVVAVALAAALVASDARLQGGVGDVNLTKADLHDESLVVRRAYGDVTVDLRHLDSARPVSLVASVGKGHLRVAVPKGVRLRVDAHVGHGTIDTGLVNHGFDRVSGFGRQVTHTYFSPAQGRALLARVAIDADVGLGDIDIGSGRDYLASAVNP